MVTIVNFGVKMDLNNGSGSGHGSGSNSPIGLKPSLGIKHGTIQTQHYFGPNYQGTFKDFSKGDNPGKASSGLTYAPSFAFHNLSSAKTWEALMDYGFHVTQMGDYYLINSASAKITIPKSDWKTYGPNMTINRDDLAENFSGWLAATNGSHAIEYVKPHPGISLFELPEHTPDYSQFGMTDVKVPIKMLVGAVPLNKVGYYISKIRNLEQDLRKIIFTNPLKERPGFNPETEAYLEFLEEIGLGHAREITAIGVQNLEKAIAATYSGTDAKTGEDVAVLVADVNLYRKASDIARKQGLSGEEAVNFVKAYILYHEIYHVLDHRKGLSEKKIEAGIGAALAEFFGERASQVREKIATYYRALAKEGRDYALRWQEGGNVSARALSQSGLEGMVKQYISEAKEKGLAGEEARDYVANKLESELGETATKNMKDSGDNTTSTESAKNNENPGETDSEGGNAETSSESAPQSADSGSPAE